MQFKTINSETIKKANSYVPLSKKIEFVQYASERVFDSLNITADKNGKQNPLPTMYKVNMGLRNRYLMGAFVKLYLNEEYDPVDEDEWLMAQDDYDAYAGGHIFNEFNRLKADNDVRNKTFDILSDYKELTNMFDTNIDGLCKAMNDVVSRMMMAIESMATPEEVVEMIEEINEKQTELKKYMEEKAKK